MERGDFPKSVLTTVAVAMLTAFLTSLGFLFWVQTDPQSLTRLLRAPTGEDRNATDAVSAARSSERAVIAAVKKANPAVVAITISKNVPVYEQYLEEVPSPFSQFFGNDFFNFSVPRVRKKGTEKKEIGGGSGFLVSNDGYIVTNRHVVEDEEAEYTAFLNDGKKYTAAVVARDPALDLAIIKIDGSNFPYLAFGDSNALEVGQSVIAIGNALAEFRNTVSVGVVSGLSRRVVADDRAGRSELLEEVVQTDAGINPGNSGGPLLNLSGEVIGVNVAVALGSENIGFALPANLIKGAVDSVKKEGEIVRPFLGIRYLTINQVDYGVLVVRGETSQELAVIPGSPADKAGIVENDIILSFDGVKLDAEHSLASLIRKKKVGDQITLRIWHKGEEKTVKAVLEKWSRF